MSEPGRRRGSCGRETRDQGAGFPLGTPPDRQAPPLPQVGPPTPGPPARGAPRTPPAGRGLLSSPLSAASRPAPRPDRRPAPHAAPGSGKRGGRRAGPGTGRSPRGRFPPPPLTPGTRPGPRGRHRVTQPGRRRGRGGRGLGAAASPPRLGGPAIAGGDPEPPAPPRRAPLGAPPPLLSEPESVTGIGFQHGGQEAASRGGENIPAAPAPGGAGTGRRPREPPRGLIAGPGPQKGRLGVEMARETRGPNRPPTPDGEPQGHRWAWGGG